ncbi:hypothetical protein RN001_016179 [Aquatica leii]|uniref:Vitellogenin n=1 Tax=Aquatica leii TaxID=1421715 RepID=A0AAN7SN19_9COLE|nr:hypothetical protein RN001_016179 [Aquatica leii]
MGWKLLLCLFVGLASATTNNNSAWRPGAKYVYNVYSYTLTRHSGNYCTGIVMQAKFTVTPKSESILMAMISNVQYARFQEKMVGECAAENVQNPHQLAYKPLQLAQKPFRINMENGVIKSINFFEDLETYKINMLRSVISEIQFDMQGENLIQNFENQLPENNTFAGVFKTMEDTVTGKYATLYELNELPSVATQARPWLVPYPQLKGTDGVVIEVLKTKDYSNSKQRVGYHYGFGNKDHWEPFSNRVGNFFSRTGVTRAIITGKPSHFTIQTAVTTEIIAVSPLHNSDEKFTVTSSNNLTLLNFEPHAPQLEEPSSLKPSLHYLTYQYNSQYPTNGQERQRQNQQQDWSNEENQFEQGYRHQQQQQNKNSKYFDVDSSESNDYDSMSSEYKWQQNRPQLQDAPDSPLLPFTMGYMGQPVKNHKKINIIQAVKTLANDIGKSFQHPESNNQNFALPNFLTLSALIRTMNFKELQTVTNMLYNQEEGTLNSYSWKAHRDALAEAGTGPALLILQNLILENKIPPYAASIIVDQITHSVRQPTEEYMRFLFEFTKNEHVLAKSHLKTRSILGYANLVRKVYVSQQYSHDQFPVHIFGGFDTPSGNKFVRNEYVPYLEQRLEEAIAQNDYQNTQIYISALGYVADRSILRVFRPYFNGNKYATPFQRLQMVVALRPLATYFPKFVQSALFKIYQNSAEQEDVRVASVFLLILTEPSAYIFQRMAAYISVDHSEQVNSAVESVIRTIAQLEGHDFEKIQKNAQSVLHLLPGKSYGMQYSKQYMRHYFVPEMKSGFKQVFETIQAADHLMPEYMQYSVMTNIAGIKHETFRMNFMVNSVDQFINALLRQTQTYKEQLHKNNQQSHQASQNQWSSESIFRILNVNREKPEPLDGRVDFKIGGMHTTFTFSDEDIALLSQVMQQMEQQLQSKNNFQFTKFVNNHDMTISVATVTGMPSIYTFENPALIHLDGHGSVVAEPKISSEGGLRIPKNVKVDGQINVIILKKRQGQLGFVAPFESHHYLAGYERNVQLQVSLNVGIVANIEKGHYTVEISPVHLQRDQQLLEFNSLPYIAIRNILDFQPIVSGQNTYIIKEDKPHTYQQIIGEDATGVALQVHFENDNKLDWAWLYQQISRHDPISLLNAPWYDESVYYSNLKVAYSSKHSSNDRIQVQIGYKQSQTYENCPNAGAVDISQLYKIPNEPESRQQQFYQKACSGISNANVQVFDVQVKSMGKQEITYFATAGVASSYIDEKSHFLFYAGRQPSNQHKIRPYKVAAYAKTHIPKSDGLDPMFALQSDYNANVQGQFAFGENEQSAAEINMQAALEKTQTAKNNLKHHLLVHKCKKEIAQGNYQLPACKQLTMEANIMDHVSVKLQYQRVGKQFQNATMKFLDVLKYYFNEYFEQNLIDSTGNVANQINIDAKFHTNNYKVDVDIQSERGSYLFNNIDIHEYVRPLVTIYPVYSTHSRILGYAHGLSLQRPSCVIDETYANTLDNLTYPINLGKDWTVALLYAPSYANYPNYNMRLKSHPQQHQYQKLQQYGDFQQQEQYQNQQQQGQLREQTYQSNSDNQQHQRGFQQENQQWQNQQWQGQQWQNQLHDNQNQNGPQDWQNQQSQYRSSGHQGWQHQEHHQQQQPQHQQHHHHQQQQQHYQQGQEQQQYQNHQGHHRSQGYVKHNDANQIEHYAVLVRDSKNSKNSKEVKVTLRSHHTNYEFVEIDMVPSGNSKLRADVLVNQQKQKINQEHGLQYNGFITMSVLPNGEVVFRVRDVFFIVYDGQRFRLTILDNNKFRNDIRGLCGTFSGNKRTDFTCPQNCILYDSAQFVASYQLNGQNQNQHQQHQCNYEEVIYGDVISDQEIGLNYKRGRYPTSHNVGCTRHQTKYFIDDDGSVCFTVKMHPVCKQHCQSKKQITKTVGVYCVPKGQNTDLWIKQIEKGASPNFNIKSPTKHVPMNVDQSCSPHL